MPDYAARIRAARGWANLTQDDLAEALGREKQWVLRRERPPERGGYQEPTKGDRIAIASICGVPIEFLEEGFGGEAQSEISERLAELRGDVQALDREILVRVREALRQNAADDPPADQSPPGQQQ